MEIYAYLGLAVALGMAVNSLRIPGHFRIFLVAAVVFAIGWSGGAGDPQAIPKLIRANAEHGSQQAAKAIDCKSNGAELDQSMGDVESRNSCMNVAEPVELSFD